jgi:hypothetical protein
VRWLILLVACLLLASPASAQGLGIGVSPGELWLGEGVEISCWFGQDPGASGVWAEITEPILVSLTGFSRINDTYFSAGYTPPVIGRYAISCTNGSEESPGTGFSVGEFETEIVGYPGQAFNDAGIRIEAEVIKNDGDAVQLTSGVDFSVTLDGVGLGTAGFPYYYTDRWVIDTESLEGFGPGGYDLMLVASYQGREASCQIPLDVTEPLEFRIESVSPDEVHGGENVTVLLTAAYHNSSVLAASELSAELDGEELSIDRSPSGFSFTCPELEPEPHTLEVSLEYEGLSASDSAPLYYMVQVHGEIRNAGGGGVSANMRFLGEGWQKSIRTNVNGAFNTNVPAGGYTLEMGFPAGIFVTVEGLEIYQKLRDFVRFDTFTTGELDGIIVAKAFALEFSPGFGRLVVKAEYDGSAVSDESRLMVYTCRDWNLDSRSCSGSWKEVDFELDAMRNEVEFGLEHLSGFVIGMKGELELEASIDREDYVTGQSIKLTGVVRDEGGRAVGSATISYSISGGADGDVRTNSNGVFSASIPVPKRGGEYTLSLRASKGFSRQDRESLDFTVIAFRDFAIIPPLRVDASEGSEASPDIIIINTGQEVLEDFRVSLSGIPAGWYQAEPRKWDSLLPDEEKRVVLKIRPESPEQEIYTIGIDVACDQASKSESFVMYVKPLQEEQEAEAIETNASGAAGASPLDSVTVYLIGSHEALINTLSMLASAGILFLIARRLKAGRRRGSRAWLTALLESVKSEVAVPVRSPGRPQRPGRARPARVKRRAEKHIEVEV